MIFNLMGNSFSRISKDNIFIVLCILCLFFTYFFSSYVYLLFTIVILSFSEFKKNIPYLILALCFSFVLFFIDVESAKNLLFFLFFIILFSSKFNKNLNQVTLYFSFFITIFTIFLLFNLDQKNGNFSDVFKFEQRLWLYKYNGYEINPNALGLWSSMAVIGFFINKKYIFMLFPLVILMLTQSRSSIVFLFIVILLGSRLKLKKIIPIFILFTLSVLFIYLTPVWDRFLNDGENGRIDRFNIYKDYLYNEYFYGIGAKKYSEIAFNYGTLDNLYYVLILNYGFFSILIVGFLIYSFLRNKIDENYRYRLSFFVGLLFLGFFEGSFAVNSLLWIYLAMCFNCYGKYRV